MRKIWKQFTLFVFAIMLLVTVKLNANAEVIWNTSGEKTDTGESYLYKYWDGWSWAYCGVGKTELPKLSDISYNVTYCYEEAYKMIALVNEQRRKAGVPELQAKDELMDVAMMRAAECAVYWSHTRPDGSSSCSASIYSYGENIACSTYLSAERINKLLVNSSGHYAQMIDKWNAYAGYGCVKVDGKYYYVQIFSLDDIYYEDGYDYQHPENNRPVQWNTMTLGSRKDYTAKFIAKVNPRLISLKSKSDAAELYVGEETNGYPYTYCYGSNKKWICTVNLSSDQYNVKVLTPSLCSYSNGKLKALKAGTAKIQYTLKADSSLTTTLEVKIKEKPVKKGNTYTVGNNTYKITSTKSKTVSFYKGKTDASAVSVPKTVKISGKTYKVTAVAANAFKGNKKVTNVTIGANVTKIGSKAFYGCSNLKKITVKSTKLKSVGKSALKGVYKKAVIKVPKSKLTKYKKLFKGKGQKKTVTIKK